MHSEVTPSDIDPVHSSTVGILGSFGKRKKVLLFVVQQPTKTDIKVTTSYKSTLVITFCSFFTKEQDRVERDW